MIAGAATCRVCGRPGAVVAGTVEYLAGFACVVHDCPSCGCRFTPHTGDVYDRLHQSGALSYYGYYRRLGEQCRDRFARGDLAGLRALLSATPKYRAVLDRLDRLPASARILEVGCSRGYLAAASILAGRDILGVDTSPDAIAAATAAFGDHFAVVESPIVAARGPYDVIYHVGLIGCVGDPVGLTRQLLSWLKPGGRLFFNAPNREALYLRGQLWIDSAPPPDLVTLFPRGFWSRQCADAARVTETIDPVSPPTAVAIGLRALGRRKWTPPVPQSLTAGDAFVVQPGFEPAPAWRWLETAVTKAAALTGLSRLAPVRSSEFGLLVEMEAR